MNLEEAKNGKNEIPKNLAPKTQALAARIMAHLREREAMGGVAAHDPESPAEAPPPGGPDFPPAPGSLPPSEASRRLRRPSPVGDLVASLPLPREAAPIICERPLEDLVEEAVDRYGLDLSPRARRVYVALLTAGLARLKAMGKPISKALRQVVLFAPTEALGVALDISPRTLYRAITELKDKGLVASRPWHTTATVHGRPGVYKAGNVWAVRLPNRDGRARLYPEDLQHPWRDLDADIAAGRTAWAELNRWRDARAAGASGQLAESKEDPPKDKSWVTQYLLSWSLSPVGEARAPLEVDSATGSLAGLLARLGRAKPQARRRQVEEIALGLAKEFRDESSTRFYAWAIWNAFRAHIYGYRPDAMDIVLWAIRRVSEGLATGSVRRPGALLVRLLKEQGLMDLFRQAPSWRVA
ncbi:MAG: hypothetical protein P3W93_001855 [Thermus sp.]|nr:hypothetical protein [Thermus sp.]